MLFMAVWCRCYGPLVDQAWYEAIHVLVIRAWLLFGIFHRIYLAVKCVQQICWLIICDVQGLVLLMHLWLIQLHIFVYEHRVLHLSLSVRASILVIPTVSTEQLVAFLGIPKSTLHLCILVTIRAFLWATKFSGLASLPMRTLHERGLLSWDSRKFRPTGRAMVHWLNSLTFFLLVLYFHHLYTL